VFKSRGKVPEKLLEKFKGQALIYTNKAGWVTESIMLQFLQKIWLNLNVNSDKEDKFFVHQMDTIKSEFKKGNSVFEYIPVGWTGLVQPLDTCINKVIKYHPREKFKEWFDLSAATKTNCTPKGYPHPPSPE